MADPFGNLAEGAQAPPAAAAERGTLEPLISRLIAVRLEAERREAELKELHKQEAAIEGDLFDALEKQGIRSVRTERGLFLLNDIAWASVEDRAKAIEWADHHRPELLTLNNSALSAHVRKAIAGEEGYELPEGVGFKTSRKVTWRDRK